MLDLCRATFTILEGFAVFNVPRRRINQADIVSFIGVALKNLAGCVASSQNIATLCVGWGSCAGSVIRSEECKAWNIFDVAYNGNYYTENGQTTSEFSSTPDMNINCTSNFLFPVIIDVIRGAGEDVIPLITSAREGSLGKWGWLKYKMVVGELKTWTGWNIMADHVRLNWKLPVGVMLRFCLFSHCRVTDF